MEPTTKKCKKKQKKTTSRKQMCSKITVNSLGNPYVVNPEEEEGRAAVGRICRKGRLTVNGPRHVTDASAFTRRLYTQTWASAGANGVS